MNSTRGESYDLICEDHGKKTLMFGIALLVVGLMMQNRYTIPEILVVISLLFIVKGMLTIVSTGRKS